MFKLKSLPAVFYIGSFFLPSFLAFSFIYSGFFIVFKICIYMAHGFTLMEGIFYFRIISQ